MWWFLKKTLDATFLPYDVLGAIHDRKSYCLWIYNEIGVFIGQPLTPSGG